MANPNFGWSLPPGVSQRMIDESFGECDEEQSVNPTPSCCGIEMKRMADKPIYDEWLDEESGTVKNSLVAVQEQWKCYVCKKIKSQESW